MSRLLSERPPPDGTPPPSAAAGSSTLRPPRPGGPDLPAAVLAARHGQAAAVPGDDLLLQLMRSALAAQRFDAAAAAVATELAAALDCERAALGMCAQGFVQLRALSHGASVAPASARASALVRATAAAMEEALDQGCSLLYPQHPEDRPRITQAHARLSTLSTGGRDGAAPCLLTVPMFIAGEAVGALALQRPLERRFDPATVQRIEAMATTLAPLLALRFERERSALQRLRKHAARRLARLTLRQRQGLAAGALGGTAALLALLASPWQHEVSASTHLEGQVQRAVVAPVDGYLKSAQVRAGDTVRAGQLLAELSDEDLQLERRRWQTEVARHESTFAEAQARQDRAQLVIADARAGEARAQLALTEQQLARSQLVAPFDALVIKGDLSQQLGAPVKRGDLLLTLAPSRAYRVMLQIDERDVGQVPPGTRGAVTLSALPDQRFALVVDRVLPVARTEGGRNLFEAEARLLPAAGPAAEALRPGLQGEARLDAGQRPLAWLISHRLTDWLRLQWWNWIG